MAGEKVTVIMQVGMGGPDCNLVRGDEYTCDAEEAARLIESEAAIPKTPTRQKAKKGPAETR